MVKSIFSKFVWVGRATVFLMGSALMLALVFGMASTAFGANGGNFILGSLNNTATAITKLTGTVGGGPALRVSNPATATGSTALDLQVATGKAPMKVNSQTKVSSLNTDKLDGKDFSAFDAAHPIINSGPLPAQGFYISKGGTLILSVSGSAYRGTGSSNREGWIGMDVLVDGQVRGSAIVYTNERNSHKAFVPSTIVVKGLPAGTHTIRLEGVYDTGVCNTASEVPDNFCTATDFNDSFQVTVMELPD